LKPAVISLETSTHKFLGKILRNPDDIKPGDIVRTGIRPDAIRRKCRILDKPRQITLNGIPQENQFFAYAVEL
jgi:hypothetical protein